MTTAKSSFSFGRFWPIYCNTLRRYRSAGIFYTILGFIFLPLQYLLTLIQYGYRENFNLSGILGGPAHTYNLFSGMFFTGMTLVVSFVLAVNLFSFLHSKRAVDVYHSLPVTRTELLLAAEAAGVTILWLGILLNFIFVALIGAAYGYAGLVPAILLEALAWMACSFVIFTITVFAAVNVGTVFDTWICSLALNGAVSVMYLIMALMCAGFLYGFNANDESVILFAYKLSPVSVIIGRQMMSFDRMNRGADVWYFVENNWAVLIWFLIGIGVLALSVWAYRKRKSEAAESVGTFGPVQIFVRIAATFIGGYALGMLLVGVFSIQNDFAVAALVFAGAVIVYLIFDAVLSRNLKTIVRAIPVSLVFAVLTGGSVLAITTGGFGFETRVPSLENVQSATIDYRGRYSDEVLYQSGEGYERAYEITLQDPETIAAVLALHQEQVDQHLRGDDEDQSWNALLRYELSYQLKDGSKMERRYTAHINDTLISALVDLELSPEYLEKAHPVFWMDASKIDELSVRSVIADDWTYRRLTESQYEELLAALQEDMRSQPKEELISAGAPALGYLQLSFEDPGAVQQPGNRVLARSEVLVTESFRNTLSMLEELGLGDAMRPDYEKAEKVYAGISNMFAYSNGAAVHQAKSYSLYDLEYEIFVDGARAGEEMPFGSFFECSEEEYAELRPYFRSSLPINAPMVVVAVQTQESAGDELSGYFVCDFRELPDELEKKLLAYAEEVYGQWMVEWYYHSIGLEYNAGAAYEGYETVVPQETAG
ncbi:MAG TPA: ABC transporter permease [Candidatus Fimivivens faecavium]|nr:ABC transporter permease [Candidatus Fimivivens faecavium]